MSLTFGASDTEIKKQYRKLASIYHPDKNGGSKKSEEAFKVIVNTYQTLSNKVAQFMTCSTNNISSEQIQNKIINTNQIINKNIQNIRHQETEIIKKLNIQNQKRITASFG